MKDDIPHPRPGSACRLCKELPGIPVGRTATVAQDQSATFAYNGRFYRFNKFELRTMPDWFALEEKHA
jgi:hypothetical protein